MAGDRGTSSSPVLTPVVTRAEGRSGWIALGLVASMLVVLVGISLAASTNEGGPAIRVPLGTSGVASPAVPAAVTVSPSTSAAASPSATPSLEPPWATPMPRVSVSLGAVPTCPPGSTPSKPGRFAQARPPTSTVTPMAFDRRAGRMVVLVAVGDSQKRETWTFDVCTNTWTRMHPKREPDNFWGQLAYDVDSDVTITIDVAERRVWAYDLDANTWTAKVMPPLLASRGPALLVYDPVTGSVVVGLASSALELWTYDVDTDAWTMIRQAGAPESALEPQDTLFEYDPSVDRIVAYSPHSSVTARFDLRSGTWSRSRGITPVLNFGYFPSGGEIAYDEAMQRTVVFGDGRMIAYDAAADRWEFLRWPSTVEPQIGPRARMLHSMVYDPINERLVVLGGEYRRSSTDLDVVWVEANDVLGFDPATRAWTTLLKASEVRTLPA